MVVFCRPSNSKLFVIVQNPVFTFEYVTCEVSRLKTQRSSLGVSHHVSAGPATESPNFHAPTNFHKALETHSRNPNEQPKFGDFTSLGFT